MSSPAGDLKVAMKPRHLVMMSLGLGMSRQTRQLYESAGSMKTITVYSFNQKGNETEITDDTIKQLKQLMWTM